MKMTKLWRKLLPTGLIAFLSVTACGPGEEAPSLAVSGPGTPVVRAAVVEVRIAPMPVRVEVTGQVAAVSQATLSSKIHGTIQEVRVRDGSIVSRGQTLVVLDSRDLRANLARAEADVENRRVHLDRIQQLFKLERGSVAEQELDDATRSFRVAQAEERVAAAQLSYTVITAPFDGVITEKKVEIGELASPGRPLMKLEDPRHLRLEATVGEGDLKLISRGDKIPIIIDALGQSALSGTVSQILPAGDPQTHTFLVKVDLPQTAGLRSGMFGRLQLDRGVSQTIVLPRSAMIERGELTSVFVVGDDRVARLRLVRVGRTVGSSVEILSGLNLGERVLADAGKGQDGMSIQILDVVAMPLTP
jgi:RND family efflux transporter MFP subunit